MKKYLVLLLITTSFSYSQSPVKFINLDRSYYNNESVLTAYTDKLTVVYDLKNNYSISSDFSMMNLNLIGMEFLYSEEAIRRLYSADITIEKKIALPHNWSLNFAVNPQLRSNFTEKIKSNDILLNGNVTAKKEFKNKSTLAISAQFGTLFGKPIPYLEFAYTNKLSARMNIAVGFPKTYLKYNINQNHSLGLQSNYEGYYTRVSNNSYSRVIEGEIINYRSLYFSKITTEFIYGYKFTDNSVVSFAIGKSFKNQLEIDENNNQSTKINFKNNLTVSLGFKYNLNFK